MKIESGKFYFLDDKYFEEFQELKLMRNKENGNKRPCYFCFEDNKNKEILWFVPISSKVEKYKEIYKNKMKNRKKVYNFVFGEVLNKEKVFLIQNIFPTKKEYIIEKYKTRDTDVEISRKLNKKVTNMGNKVILLAEKGINIPFYNIIQMKEILLNNNIKTLHL